MKTGGVEKRYALIAGAGGGFGAAAVRLLSDKGFTVFACDLSFADGVEGNIHRLHMDVTDEESVTRCFEYVKTRTGRLDIVSSLAGISSMGSLVEVDSAQLKRILDINVLGMYRVNQHAFPLVREALGRYINVSSEYAAIDAIPFNAYYTLSKHAVKIYNNGLRREMLNWGIRVVEMRPGVYKTHMTDDLSRQFEQMLAQTVLYKAQYTKLKKMMISELARAKSVAGFLRAFEKAALAKKPRLVYKPNNAVKMKFLKLVPARMLDRIFYRLMLSKEETDGSQTQN